jgi:hypothetical protein
MQAAQQPRAIEINLLQIKMEDNKGASPLVRNLAITLVAVSVASLGWIWFDAKSDIKRTEKQLTAINAQIKEHQSKLDASPTAGGVAEFRALPGTLMNGRPKTTDVLDKLSALMPTASNLTVLTFGEDNTLKVTGNFMTSEDVIAFMQAAKTSAHFSLISTSGMTKVPAGPEDKNAPVPVEPPLPVIQVTFDLKYKQGDPRKG